MRSNKAADLVIEHLPFGYFYLVLHLFVFVESVQQRLVDGLVHPVFGLFGTMGIEVTVLFGESDIFLNILPYVHDTGMVDGGAADSLWFPSGF